jgi:CSLREA domain-containing protein
MLAIASALALALLAAGMTAATVVHASAKTLTVNTTADGDQGPGSTCSSPAAGGACTLRAAIEVADQDSGDTITVPAGTYGVNPGLGVMDVTRSMTIAGAGAATTIVDGGRATGIFEVDSGTVAISGLTVRNGFDGSLGAAGTDIANDATLSLTNDVVSGGSAPDGAGGGIASDGPLTLDGVVVSGNEAGDAGGLALLGGVTATITRSTISDNVADGTCSSTATSTRNTSPDMAAASCSAGQAKGSRTSRSREAPSPATRRPGRPSGANRSTSLRAVACSTSPATCAWPTTRSRATRPP